MLVETLESELHPDETSEPVPVVPVLDPLRLPPRMRARPIRLRVLLLLYIMVGWPVAACGLLFAQAYYPSFRDSSAPGGGFTLAFPGEPYWSDWNGRNTGDGVLLTGNFTRQYRGNRLEVYRIQVSGCPTAARGQRANEMLALVKATELATDVHSSRPINPHIGKMPGYACADFERVHVLDDPPITIAGRVIVQGDRYYILTVDGPDVGLDDWRVRRFFNSFRLGSP